MGRGVNTLAPVPAVHENRFTIRLDLEDNYRFVTDFGEPGAAPLLTDEPPPLGEGLGPSASRLLAAAVGNCLSASALFCLRRAHIDVRSMHAEVDVTMARNEAGRLRIGGIAVRIEPEVADEDVPRMKRCLEIFENYCTVAESVRSGIDVDVTVDTRAVPVAA
jgi:organic hydroperoxide reductase OsmC/OhrA